LPLWLDLTSQTTLIEKIFAGFASLLTQGRAASHPQPAEGGQSKRAEIPSPRPPFLFVRLLGLRP